MIKYGVSGDKLVCEFSCRMDTENCNAVSNELLERAGKSTLPVVFDMRSVDYVASAFLGLCAGIVKKIGKDKFSLVNIHPNVKKVFKIAKLDTLIIFD